MPLGAFKLNSLGKFTAPAGRTALTITAFGTAAISTAQSKFGGASLDFGDGVSDYYKVAASSNYFGGSGDMTFEFFYYRKATGSGLHITDFRPTGSDSGSWTVVDFEDGSTTRLGVRQNGWLIATNIAVPLTTWTHIAIVKQGTTIKWYKNGTLTDTNTGVDSTFTSRTDCFIGANYADQTAGNNINAYIDELRISNTARYTANFTAPTAAFVNDTNTLLLIHANGTNGSTTVIDDIGTNALPRTPKTITVGGNAKVSTAQFKYGSASALFDGTSDYLSVPGLTDLAFGTGDFTLEAWVRQSARSDQMVIFDTRNSGNTSGGFILYMRADNYMELYWNSAYVSSANPLPTVNTWYHVAVSRSGSALKVFVDGTSVISVTDSQNHSATGPFIVGQDFQLTATPGNSWNGYMDEVRFSNTARYTANFTAPAAAFVNDRNTLVLLHCEGANLSTTFTDDNT